ncbi:MAG: biotin synthase BioB, partial [Pseudomonadota bacterium]
MNAKHFLDLAESVIAGEPLDERAQEELTAWPESRAFDLLPGADALREHFFGRRVSLCCITNGKSGRCPEDCRFCAQSSHSRTGVKVYPLLPVDELRQGGGLRGQAR